MSGWNSTIADWMSQDLEWQYINQSTLAPFDIPANSQYQLPRGKFTFSYPEGVLLQLTAGFTHPSCGIRIESEPKFDTKETFTVANLALGMTRPDILVYGLLPPQAPAGLYGVRIVSPWVWKSWLRLYLINTDDVPHRVIGHTYHMAVLKNHRPIPEKEES